MTPRRRWIIVQDALLALLVAAVGLAEVLVPFDSVQGDGSTVGTVVTIIVATGFLVFRRTVPLALIGVPLTWVAAGVISGGDLYLLFFGQLVPFYLALYSGARHAPRRDAIAVCATIVGTIVLADFTVPELQGPSELLFHWGVFIAVLGVGVGLRLSENRAVAAALRAAQVETDAREAALRAVVAERARIARELHDILGHSVSVMVVQAGAAAQAVDDDPEFVRRALEAIRTTGTQSLDEVRRVVALLREDGTGTAPQPGLAQLGELVDQAAADGLAVEFVETGDGSALAPGQQLCVYRIVQESLTNVRKHAPAATVRVEVDHGAAATEVDVADDGGGARGGTRGASVASRAAPGASRRRKAGHGIVGMRERVAVYGGSLEAGPDAAGWRVRATIPVGVPAAVGEVGES